MDVCLFWQLQILPRRGRQSDVASVKQEIPPHSWCLIQTCHMNECQQKNRWCHGITLIIKRPGLWSWLMQTQSPCGLRAGWGQHMTAWASFTLWWNWPSQSNFCQISHPDEMDSVSHSLLSYFSMLMCSVRQFESVDVDAKGSWLWLWNWQV